MLAKYLPSSLAKSISRILSAADGVFSWTPALWFLASEQGVWYDPSDMATMFTDSAGTTPVTAVEQPVGKILDKSGRGNHVTQATTAQKPVLSARTNLLTYTEDFTHAAWGRTNLTAAGDTLTATATAFTNLSQSTVISSASASITGIIELRAGTLTNAYLGVYDGTTWAGTSASSEIISGPGTLTNVTGALYSISGLSPSEWTKVRVTRTGFAGTSAILYVYPNNNVSAPAGSTLRVRYPQLEEGPVATTYQRVTTATDYDTVGFPHFGKLDRVDDNMTAATGGGGTTGIIVCAAIRAGGAGNARTIFSDRGTNTGYRLSVNASNQLVLSAGNGAAHTEVVGPTITAGTDYVVTGWHDGANLNVQANAGAATSAAFGTATAGTAGFTIGKDNGAATGYYSERIYEIVYRKDDTSSAGDRTTLINYMAAQAGITL